MYKHELIEVTNKDLGVSYQTLRIYLELLTILSKNNIFYTFCFKSYRKFTVDI